MAGGPAQVDRRLADAWFLVRHPGWTWQALQDTPADIVGMVRLIEQIEGEVAASRARMQR